MPRQKLGLPVEPKGFGQNEGMKMKNLYTRQVENLKRRLGQKWVSRWTENPKGRSRQKLGIKRKTMSHWSLSIQNPVSTSSSNDIDQSASPSTKVIKWWDARRYKGNSRVETQWIIHFTQLFYFLCTNCINSFIRRLSLTRTPASCTQKAYSQAIQNQYKYTFQLNVPTVFLFSVLFCEERPRFNLWYMHWQ